MAVATGLAILALTLVAAIRLVARRLAGAQSPHAAALRRRYWLSLALTIGGLAAAIAVFVLATPPEGGRRGAIFGLIVFCGVAFPAGLWNALLWKEIARLSRRDAPEPPG